MPPPTADPREVAADVQPATVDGEGVKRITRAESLTRAQLLHVRVETLRRPARARVEPGQREAPAAADPVELPRREHSIALRGDGLHVCEVAIVSGRRIKRQQRRSVERDRGETGARPAVEAAEAAADEDAVTGGDERRDRIAWAGIPGGRCASRRAHGAKIGARLPSDRRELASDVETVADDRQSLHEARRARVVENEWPPRKHPSGPSIERTDAVITNVTRVVEREPTDEHGVAGDRERLHLPAAGVPRGQRSGRDIKRGEPVAIPAADLGEASADVQPAAIENQLRSRGDP